MRELTTGKEQEYLNKLADMGYDDTFLDARSLELRDEAHPYHKEAVEDFSGFMLCEGFITPLQYDNKIKELFGAEEDLSS